MSSTLYWEPIQPKKGKPLDTKLKFALHKRFEQPINIVFDQESMEYLNGLKDADVTDAQTLIDAIEKYGCIELREEF